MNVGDRVLLFQPGGLPFDFGEGRPIQVSSTLAIHDTPQGRLNAHPATTGYMLPGYGLPIGINNCCLVDSGASNEAPDERFFPYLTALRMWKPVPIVIGGSYTVGNGEAEFYFASPLSRYDDRAVGGRCVDPHVTANDLRQGGHLSVEIVAMSEQHERRLVSAWMCFSQVTLGSIKAFQPAIVTLFSAIEVFFTNGNSQPIELSRRVARFLDGKIPNLDVEAWLADAYNRLRGRYAHGRYDAIPQTTLRPEREEDFHRLHEIVRLSLLGLITQPKDWRVAHCALTGTRMRQLDVLDRANSPTFLTAEICV